MSNRSLKTTLVVGTLISVLSVLWGCGTAIRARSHQLSAAEVHARFSDQTITSRNLKTGTESVSFYNQDGTVNQIRDGRLRTGKWRVKKDGQKCMAMQSKRERCRIVKRDADNVYRTYKPGYLWSQPIIAFQSFVPGDQLDRATAKDGAALEGANDIAALQRLLREAGYAPGPVDGIWGPRSRRALLDYQSANGLTKTEYPSQGAFEHLSGR